MEKCELVLTVKEMENNREAWLRARCAGVGGSEVAAVLGMSNWGDPYSVWARKINPNDVEEKEDTEPMKWGRRLEASIADGFAEDYGLKLQRCGLMRRKDKPWMLCSVDRLVVGKDEGVEIKTASSYMKDEWPEDGLPVQYYLQVQWYLACTGFKKWWVVALLGGNQLIVREVERNEADIKGMEDAVDKFWNEYVVPKKLPPNLNGSEHCTRAIIQEYPGKYGDKGENVLELDATFTQKIEDIKKTEEEIDRLKANVDKMKNEIRLEMGDMVFAHASYWNISFKPSQRTTVDAKKLKEKYPNIFEECKRISSTRVFTIKESKDPKRK